MSRLIQWLDHRREVVGLENWKDLAELYGVSLQTLSDVQTYHTLNMVNRSERRLLAGALRVSLRKLEQLEPQQLLAPQTGEDQRGHHCLSAMGVRVGIGRLSPLARADSNNRCFSFAI